MGILLERLNRFMTAAGRRFGGNLGSMTLEASIAVPLVLTFILALAAFVKLSVSEAGLRTAVSQAAHQLAVQAYPIRLLTETYADHQLIVKLNQWYTEYNGHKEDAEQWIEEYGPIIPEQVRSLLEQALHSADQIEQQITEPVRRAFQPIAAHYLPDHMSGSNLRISSLQYPILQKRAEPYVRLEAEYDVLIRLPFFSRTITLRAAAAERMWTGSE